MKEKGIKYNKIVKEATKLFEKYWYKGVTIDKITSKAKIAKWTFYLYFSSKDDIYKKIVSELVDLWINYVEELNYIVENIKLRLYYKLLIILVYIDSNEIIRNMYLWKINYYSKSVSSSYLREKNQEVMTNFYNNYKTKDLLHIDNEFIVMFIGFYPKLLYYKNLFSTDNDFYKFANNYAIIIIKWLFMEDIDNEENNINIDLLRKVIVSRKSLVLYFNKIAIRNEKY